MSSIKNQLFNLVRDAMRYRILRERRPGGEPQPGLPYVLGWHLEDDCETPRGDQFYAYEGELDHEIDKLLYADGEADPVGDVYDALVEAIQDQTTVPLPTGQAFVWFSCWNAAGERADPIRLLCQIEVLSASFTTHKCRIRGTILESGGSYKEGDSFGGKDTMLTMDILKVITLSLIDL